MASETSTAVIFHTTVLRVMTPRHTPRHRNANKKVGIRGEQMSAERHLNRDVTMTSSSILTCVMKCDFIINSTDVLPLKV